MRQTLKRFAKLTVGYSLVTVLGPAFMIILVPLYTRALSPADYGVTDVSLTLSGLLILLATVGIDQALNSFFFDHADPAHQRNLVTTAALVVAVMGVIFGSILVVCAVPLGVFLFKDPARNVTIYLLAVGVAIVPLYNVLGTALRLQMNLRRMNALGLTNLFVTIAANVFFVLVLQRKATGVIAAFALANLISCGLALFLAREYLRGSLSRQLLQPLVIAGIGLVPGILGYTLMMNIDRLLLTQFVPQSEIGLYAIANKLASMATLSFTAIWVAWWPLALEMANQPDAPRQYARMFEYFACGAFLAALGIGVFAPEILTIFTRDVYLPAAPYALVLLIFTGPIAILTNFFSIGLFARKQTHLTSVALLIVAAVNIVLNLVLDPRIGAWGAVWATVIAGIVWAALIYAFSQRVFPVTYRWLRISILGIVYLALILIFLLVPEANNLPMKAAAVLAFVALIPLMGIVSIQQIRIGIDAVRYRIRTRLSRA
ncbi:MAG: oligosaccharide flippase family protein [Chloroflexota bacterium]|nr:oligosaccharide flippase family protein [Chloroflexota bacterium]